MDWLYTFLPSTYQRHGAGRYWLTTGLLLHLAVFRFFSLLSLHLLLRLPLTIAQHTAISIAPAYAVSIAASSCHGSGYQRSLLCQGLLSIRIYDSLHWQCLPHHGRSCPGGSHTIDWKIPDPPLAPNDSLQPFVQYDR